MEAAININTAYIALYERKVGMNMKTIYYYLSLKQSSPLCLGSGESEETNQDVRMNRNNLPFIPGSSLAGVLRSCFEKTEAKSLFGYETLQAKDNIAVESRLIVSDAVLGRDVTADDIVVSVRDGIGLDDWGLTIPGEKYDFQVVEGTKELIYHAVIEWTGSEQEEEEQIRRLWEPRLQEIIHSGIRVGAKISRGYGRMEVAAVKREFLLPQDMEAWLDYRPMRKRFEPDDHNIPIQAVAKEENQITIRLLFAIKDSVNVRVRTTDMEPLADGSVPDSIPMKNAKGVPVIPGTTWAGTFRHHMHQLLRECEGIPDKEEKYQELDYTVFGKAVRDDIHKSSNVIFSETEICGGYANSIIRNAVDRFTAAPKNTGLYTSQVWTGGEGELTIVIKDKVIPPLYLQLLLATLYDLSCGLLSVGGEAAIGRGMVEVRRLMIGDRDCSKLLNSRELTVRNLLYKEG